MNREAESRKSLAAVCRRLDDLRFAPGSSGNVSARLDSRHVLITPTGSLLRSVKPADFIRVSMTGVYSSSRRPSSELNVHLGIYRERANVAAVVHAHPPVAVGFALAHKDICIPCHLELELTVGKPVLVPFAAPGDSKPLMRLVQQGDAFLLANHGAVTLGRTPDEALHKMEALENFAIAALTARILGGIKRFSSKELAAIRAFAANAGIQIPGVVRKRSRRK